MIQRRNINKLAWIIGSGDQTKRDLAWSRYRVEAPCEQQAPLLVLTRGHGQFLVNLVLGGPRRARRLNEVLVRLD